MPVDRQQRRFSDISQLVKTLQQKASHFSGNDNAFSRPRTLVDSSPSIMSLPTPDGRRRKGEFRRGRDCGCDFASTGCFLVLPEADTMPGERGLIALVP